MDPTQQQPIIPPPADAPTVNGGQLDPVAAGLMQPPLPQQPMNNMNPFFNMGMAMGINAMNGMPPLPSQPGTAPLAFPTAAAAMPQMNPMMQFPMINDPIILGQLTGFPGELLANSPSMMAGAQQFLAQRMMMQQQNLLYNPSLQPGVAPVQGIITPQQMQMMHQQRLQAQLAAVNAANAAKVTKSINNKNRGGKGGAKKNNTSGATGADGTVPDANTTIAPNDAPPGVLPAIKEDPGGKVLWAKLSNAPWWPAKLLDQTKDRSFPTDADPPRPTSIPIRFFGTHEFAWVGSKRALVDWEEGIAQGYRTHSKESVDHDAFILGIDEAETYLKEKTLPDVFYIIPHVIPQPGMGYMGPTRKPKKHRGGASRDGGGGGGNASKKFAATGMINGEEYPVGVEYPSGTTTADIINAAIAPSYGLAPGAMYPSFTGAGGGARGAGTAATAKPKYPKHVELTPEERAQLVFQRKKQRLNDLGLLAPPESPFINGAVPENPALLAKLEEWEAQEPELMKESKEKVEKMASKQPRASVFRAPVVSAEAAAAQYQQQLLDSAAAMAAIQSQSAAYMMGMMGMNQHGLSLASFV